jgi:hypothetical protein
MVGQIVDKVGISTGWTYGQVSGTCIREDVGGTDITYLCQTEVQMGSTSGDSGSPVFIRDGLTDNVYLAGIHWGSAGNTAIFSPNSQVELELGGYIVN